MAVNALAALHLRGAFPAARALVLVASTMAAVGAAGLAPYVASKWALLGLAESFRLEAQRDGAGADVVCVLPHAAADSALVAGAFGGARNSGLAAAVRALTFPHVSAVQVADAVAAAVAAGGATTFSVPAHFLPAARCLRCVLPQAAHDTLVGFMGGWYGADELEPPPQDVGGGVAARRRRSPTPRARRR
jgi:NAD(P)-dependent dehydrogenase (short-subunit alcohol dehydrogenase family)